jgi:signal transduction histidine kinase
VSRRSIRSRITAIAALISVVVLAAAAVIVVLVAQSQLRENLDRSLEQRADQVEAVVLVDATAAIANSNREDRFAQVLDAGGSVLFASDNVADVGALADLPAGRQAAQTRSDLPLEDDVYRVLIRRFDVDGGSQFVVVGENIDDVRDGVRALVWSIAVAFPIAVIVLASSVWWLVGRTLRPVEEIRVEVAAIGLSELDRRVPVPGTGDEVDLLAGTMNDMLARLESASAGQRRFVADVSHELRTPLTRMRTALEVDLSQSDSDFAATCRTVLGDAIDMQKLVDDLLFLARRDAGHAVTRQEPVDLDVVVDREVQSVRDETYGFPRIDMSGVTAAAVDGDPVQLTRLVRNLLTNAARYADSEVRVTLSDGERGVVLAVADDGPGVPPQDRERVFERFVRLDEARSARDGGTGLGLAIVRDIARSHRATATVGEAPDGGALFEIRFTA